ALLVIKTRAERYPALQQRVLELHPYSVPEVLALAVEAGAPAYLRWVQDSVAGWGEVRAVTKNDLINAVAAHGLSKRKSPSVVESRLNIHFCSAERGEA